MANRKYELICGCYVDPKQGIVFCPFHANTGKMVQVLNMIRGYFLETMGDEGEKSPFVQKIDELLPRRKQG